MKNTPNIRRLVHEIALTLVDTNLSIHLIAATMSSIRPYTLSHLRLTILCPLQITLNHWGIWFPLIMQIKGAYQYESVFTEHNPLVNESDPRSDVHYLGSSENKAWKKFTTA